MSDAGKIGLNEECVGTKLSMNQLLDD